MPTLKAGSKKIIHVNQHIIRANIKDHTNQPPICVKSGGKNYYGSSIAVDGPLVFKYSAHKPLISCGARLIAETHAAITIKK